MRGPKPTPTALKILNGNPGRRPLNKREPKPAPMADAAFDEPPAELEGHAAGRAEWIRLAPMLRRARQITEADRGALLAACLEWDLYLTATRNVEEEGLVIVTPRGFMMANPYIGIARRALVACTRIWPELGLTPSSRARLHTDGPGVEGDAFDEFDEAPARRKRG